MPVPTTGIGHDLGSYLNELEQRVSQLEAPQGFLPAWLTSSAALTAANAAEASNAWGFAIDLKAAVYSDGAHWYRADTGAVIV